MSIFDKIRGGLKKTRDNISAKVNGVLASFKKIDEDFFDELEETLILCDIGVSATERIMEELRRRVKDEKLTDPAELKPVLITSSRSWCRQGWRMSKHHARYWWWA